MTGQREVVVLTLPEGSTATVTITMPPGDPVDRTSCICPCHGCSACGVATGTLQCDWPVGPGETCDKYLCGRCAVQPGRIVFGEPRVDHCPDHARGDP